jgi:hypothetical protein
MEYEVYRHQDATDSEFIEISDFFKIIMKEDKELCNGTQKNLNAGIFLNGELHPRVEKVRQVRCLIPHGQHSSHSTLSNRVLYSFNS